VSFSFSDKSKAALATCDVRLQIVFNEVIKHRDCIVLCGHRTEEEQNEAFNAKPQRSKVQWPNSKHNSLPSLAADVAPYPLDWNDHARFVQFAGFVLGVAAVLGVKLRWGGDWNLNGTSKDESFFDGPHFEIIEETT